MPELPYTINSRYTLIERLGEGPLGISYKAFDNNANKPVCIKTIKKELTKDRDFIGELYTKVVHIINIQSDAINNVYDINNQEDQIFIVSSYIEGTNLVNYGKNKPNFIQFAENLASSLENYHKNNIVHGNLKPENIFIAHDGKFKTTDALLTNALNTEQFLKLSSNEKFKKYLAPEQKHGGNASPQSDVYSFGLILLEILSVCHPPVNIEEPLLITENPAILLEKMPISEQIRRVIKQCLNNDPALRLQSFTDVLMKLNELKAEPESPIKALPASVPESQADTQEKKYSDEESDDLKHLKKLLTLIGIIIGAMLLVYFMSVSFTKMGEMSTPEFIGMKIEDALKEAEYKDIELIIDKEIPSSRNKGIILSQNPPAGSSIKRGRNVYIILSKGSSSFQMPLLVGLPLKQAEEKLARMGIKNIRFIREYSDKYAENIILKQMPQEQYMVSGSSKITLTISTGDITAISIQIPDITGKTEKEARKILESLGLKMTVSERVESNSLKEGLVISQQPEAGSTAKQNGQVYTQISKGEAGKTVHSEGVPELIGKTVAEARAIAEQNGFKLNIENTSDENAVITWQDPSKGSKPQASTISAGTEKSVTTPDLIGKSLSEIKKLLSDKTLHIGTITYKDSGTHTENTVISQEPPANSTIMEGASVNLVIAAPPAENSNAQEKPQSPTTQPPQSQKNKTGE